MADPTKPAEENVDQPFEISRRFAAPRELVFDVWTRPEHLRHWWGPKGFVVKSASVDLRPGGLFHYCLKMPDGAEMWGKFLFREIDRPNRLVFLSSFSDPGGGTTRHPMSPDWPLEMLSTITFEENRGETTVTVQWRPYNASAAERSVFEKGRTSMQQGWKGTFEQLEAYLIELTPGTSE